MTHLPLPLLEVLMQRGIEDIDEFLRPATLAFMPDPFSLEGMAQVTERILRAIKAKEPIALFGDYDCDGILGTGILLGTLKRLGAQVRAHLPHRDDGYGFSVEAAFQLGRTGPGLIVTIDNGIGAARAVALARRLAMDVVVIDHHRHPGDLPALTLWSDSYCGAGLAWLLAAAILQRTARQDCETKLLAYAEFVAVATIGDCVPLVGPQRSLVRLGLAELAKTSHPTLRRLLTLAGVREGEVPTAREIAFGVCPRLNAAGRMAHPGLALKALFAASQEEADQQVHVLDVLNKERKQLEQEILPDLFDQPVPSSGGLIFYGPEWPKGIAGILAARAVEHFGRPAIVLVQDKRSGELTGSGRSAPGFDLFGAVNQCGHLLTRFGGHAQAIGLSLRVSALEDFRSSFLSATANCSQNFYREPIPAADLNLASVSRSFWEACRVLEPFGTGFPPLIFRVRQARLEGLRGGRARLRQGPHKLSLSYHSGPIQGIDERDYLIEVTGAGAYLVTRQEQAAAA